MITKQETVERLTSRDSEMFKEWEAKIDTALQSALSLPVYVDITSMGYSIRLAIGDAYREQGWRVDYSSDQRDGDVFKFQ